jgi:hypothetical protein
MTRPFRFLLLLLYAKTKRIARFLSIFYKYLQITDAFCGKICYNKEDYIYHNEIFSQVRYKPWDFLDPFSAHTVTDKSKK